MIAMSNYISKDTLSAEIEKINCVDYGSMYSYEAHSAVRDCLSDIKDLIDDAPIVDTVPVRCEECKYSAKNGGNCSRLFDKNIKLTSCSHGERKDGEK
jgi:hypothetical protein